MTNVNVRPDVPGVAKKSAEVCARLARTSSAHITAHLIGAIQAYIARHGIVATKKELELQSCGLRFVHDKYHDQGDDEDTTP